VDPEAYQEYLKGLYFWNKRTAAAAQTAIEHFNRAIAKDPAYALAYLGLAEGYRLISTLGEVTLAARPAGRITSWPAPAFQALDRAPIGCQSKRRPILTGGSMRITSKGQVTIPVEIREKLGLLADTEVTFEIAGNSVRIKKASGNQHRGRQLIAHLRGKGTTRMSTDEILALTRR